ncbi:MAG: DnaJ domain-containing protein [Proteobacteria bacterium]|nr:DnaJ domain-containing protein [Pseudomonadota bacterium]
MEYRDYYQVLGVGRGATADEVKRAYRKLARKFHPDVSKEKNAEARFKEVQEAYEVLKDPQKRAAYDELGSEFRNGQQFRPPPGWAPHFESRGGRGGRGARAGVDADPGFSDFFSSLFGAQSPFGEFETEGPAPRRRGEDRRARLDLTLEEAFRGGSRELTLQQPEVGGDGQLTVGERTLRVQIPAGVGQGQVIRLAGQGAAGRGGRPGDLLLEVAIAPHRWYRLEGRDVTLELPVAPWEAALGATVSTPTLGGPVELRIPAGARAGQRLRLRGRGLPGDPPGDQYVQLKVVLPPADSPRARELYETLARELPFDPRAELDGR